MHVGKNGVGRYLAGHTGNTPPARHGKAPLTLTAYEVRITAPRSPIGAQSTLHLFTIPDMSNIPQIFLHNGKSQVSLLDPSEEKTAAWESNILPVLRNLLTATQANDRSSRRSHTLHGKEGISWAQEGIDLVERIKGIVLDVENSALEPRMAEYIEKDGDVVRAKQSSFKRLSRRDELDSLIDFRTFLEHYRKARTQDEGDLNHPGPEDVISEQEEITLESLRRIRKDMRMTSVSKRVSSTARKESNEPSE